MASTIYISPCLTPTDWSPSLSQAMKKPPCPRRHQIVVRQGLLLEQCWICLPRSNLGMIPHNKASRKAREFLPVLAARKTQVRHGVKAISSV
uniref:Uncharacterized protein n=1 Tax=Picea glauca TaxID=3330 RepID=A0A124GMN8_PICGL|nr:hypothetical protein ABT39_MTgene1772 [Picea glauca]QHR90868.1 hypothetical protein Q903MT_gene4895 [Picea sitchensis]